MNGTNPISVTAVPIELVMTEDAVNALWVPTAFLFSDWILKSR